ncbi:hypothetical protein PO124_06160 [Bacillus licheniformis]|nr:hypothetical protein [Bacillus licheniformis]
MWKLIELFSDYVLHLNVICFKQTEHACHSVVCDRPCPLYAVSFHPKCAGGASFYAGIVLRLILVGALSFELAHQMKAAEFSNLYIDEQDALLPLCSFAVRLYLLVSFII